MKDWGTAHNFEPYWLNPADITEFFLVPFFGGAIHFSTADYLKAPWYYDGPAPAPTPTPPPSPSKVSWDCTVCGHVYNADADGNGMAFEDLPEDWHCPVCGRPKSSYKK